MREKDRLRKAMKKTSEVVGRTLPKPRQTNRPIYDEQEANRQYKRRVKESQTEEEKQCDKDSVARTRRFTQRD